MKCKFCGLQDERNVPMDERDSQRCTECDGQLAVDITGGTALLGMNENGSSRSIGRKWKHK